MVGEQISIVHGKRVPGYVGTSVCVCVSVKILANFRCMLPVAVVWFFSGGGVMRYVRPVLWMTSCFPVMGLMTQATRSKIGRKLSDSQGGSTGPRTECRCRRLPGSVHVFMMTTMMSLPRSQLGPLRHFRMTSADSTSP